MRILNTPMAVLVALGGQLDAHQLTVTPLITQIWKWRAIPLR
jgi:hypothetical protein